MKRRIIAQKDSFTVTLPKRWVRENGLKGGDELDIDEVERDIVISTESKKGRISVDLDLSTEWKTTIRTILSNAYRTGYDIINVKFKTKKQLELITEIVSNMLLGFEIMKTTDNGAVIESVAEPNIDDFGVIFTKILQIVSLHFDQTIEYATKNKVDVNQNESLAAKAIEYGNFCRRAISKKRITEKSAIYYWAFFATIIFVSRKLDRFNDDMINLKIRASKETIKFLEDARQLFEVLKNGYLKNDIKLLEQVHEKGRDLMYRKGYNLMRKKPNDIILLYSVMEMIRQTYISISPLSGIVIG